MTTTDVRRRVAIVVLTTVAIAGGIGTAAFAVANRRTLANLDGADPSNIIGPLTIGAVGALIAWRRRDNPVGWILLCTAAVSGIDGTAGQYARFTFATHPGALPAGQWALWVSQTLPQVEFPCGLVAMLFLLLPNGRFLSPRWRRLAVVSWVLSALLLVLFALAPGPLGASNNLNYHTPDNPLGVTALTALSPNVSGFTPGDVFDLTGLVVFFAAGVAPVLRLRRSRGEERQQLKWIAYALGITVALLAVAAPLAGPVLPDWTFDVPIIVGFAIAFPVAIGVAILRHRLYDIDVVISRALVYGALAVFITAIYIGIAVGVGEFVGSGGKPNLGLSIVATAIVAVGFQPLRERLQRVANRLVYGRRATPYQALAEFSAHVATSYATGDVLPRMARVLAEATGAQRADVWLREGERLRPAASWPANAPARDAVGAGVLDGSSQGDEHFLPLQHAGTLLGALSVTKRPGEGLTPVEQHLLADLATQAGIALENVRLAADLRERVDELRESRQRLVSAQDRERRRIERNLHDGAQQHLVALKVKLGLATMLAARDIEKAKATITQLKSDADEALETLRDLARGIYPPLLAERGLATALEAQARKATLPVGVEADGVERYDHDIEAAVYFCVLEALQNVQKYAHASSACVSLSDGDGVLRVTVSDDGDGFDVEAARRAGSGLTNMADRIAVIGGELRVWSAPGEGSRLTIAVPAVSEAAALGAAG